jgi:NAD(P)-dependent dehydrogenase (short-subunit alcohol dehydrogenase family)
MTGNTTEHIVIVGGSSGMGLALAAAVLAEGADVTIASRSAERLEHAARTLGSDRVRTVPTDITREDDVARLFKEPVDHVVTTAVDATGAYGPVADLDLANARRVVEAKLIGALAVAKHAAAALRPGGSITFTSGVASERPARGGSVIAGANGGLDALVRGLAIDLAPIRVNAISPGWVDTPMWEAIAGDGKGAALAAKAEALPVGRIGRPEDIAQATLALIRNGYMTGTVLQADGGHRLV